MKKFIRVSVVGLKGKRAYVAHEVGNWGPESEKSDYLQNPLPISSDGECLTCDDCFLVPGEEFKIVVHVSGEEEARAIFKERMEAGVHVGNRFDYDEEHKTLWLLAEDYSVIRAGKWNQNNVRF